GDRGRGERRGGARRQARTGGGRAVAGDGGGGPADLFAGGGGRGRAGDLEGAIDVVHQRGRAGEGNARIEAGTGGLDGREGPALRRQVLCCERAPPLCPFDCGTGGIGASRGGISHVAARAARR